MEGQQVQGVRDRMVSVIENLERLGIRVPKSSRLRRYLSALEATVSARGIAHDAGIDVKLLHRSFVELNDFEAILQALARTPVESALRRHIGKALSGNPHRTDDKHSNARDTQFELVVAAALHSNGCRVDFAEPDLRCSNFDGEFVVAVKRVRSEAKLNRRLKEAEEQIEHSAAEGVVAVDVSCIINPHDAPLVVNTDMAAQQRVGKLLNSFTLSSTRHFLRASPNKAVFGLIFHVAIPVVVLPDTLACQRLWATANLRPPDHPQTVLLFRILSNTLLLR